MGVLSWFFILSWVFLISGTHQLQPSQTQILLQINKLLEYPSSLQILENYNGDLCTIPLSPRLSIVCEGSFVISLKITGDYKLTSKVSSRFNGYSIPNFTLSESFSIDSFATTLTRLTNLKALSLVSLGIWGQLPDKIHRLSSLELLDLSSNFIFGSIPAQLSRISNLQSLALDSNFFNGTVPTWLGSLSNLTVLSLKNNHLKGEFPSSISQIRNLTDLALAHNELSGKLPDLETLSSLHLLDLRENNFDSKLPQVPKSLTTVLLSKNAFSGIIPKEFGKLNQIQHIDLSFNHLIGIPPSSLFSLPNISYLNLASNELSGALSDDLNCGVKLGFVDISSNKLIGSVPSCLANTSTDRVVNLEWNCFSVDSQHQHSNSFCKEAFEKRGGFRWKEIWLLICVIGGLIVAIAFSIGLFVLYRRYRSQEILDKHIPKTLQEPSSAGIASELIANARLIAQAAKLGTQGAVVYRPFTLEDLEEATDNFHKSMFLGEGSLGKVYKGKLENGTCVAIRSLALMKKVSLRNLNLRLDLLSKLRHPHLIGLLGHCIDEVGPDDANVGRLFLVYEYIPCGDFRSHLSESCPEKALTWSDRLGVLIGVAKAVHYLHTGVIPTSFSNKLKTNNILLDEHRIAKLSDYGMSVITEDFEQLEGKGDNQKSWHMTKLEDDVYKFGFILLESLVGPIVSGKGEAFLLNEMSSFGSLDGRKRMVDPIVLTTSSQESLSIVVSITNKCIASESSSRPSFEDVLWNLQYAAQVQATQESDLKPDATSQS